MKAYLEIVEVRGREIMDSRGNPTVEAEVKRPRDEEKGVWQGCRSFRGFHRAV